MACYEYKGVKYTEEDLVKLLQSQQLKTRRILELQSDLFQKGRDKENLISESNQKISLKNINDAISNPEKYWTNDMGGGYWLADYESVEQGFDVTGSTKEQFLERLRNKKEELEKSSVSKENQFLQLLNRDNNWVTFFVKSIIQDSAKKGYEKVLFPKLDTIIQIESEGKFKTYEEAEKFYKTPEWIAKNDKAKKELDEAKALTEQSERFIEISKHFTYNFKEWKNNAVQVAYENWHSLQPPLLNTAKFYENDITNILKKQGFNPNLITDEYGNTWNEITINQARDLANVLLQRNETNQIIGQANIKAMTVLVDAVNKKADTIPHEYAHHYIAWFRDTPIVQEGIKRFGSEEALVQAIGEQVVKQKGEAYNWWKKFTNWILNLLSDKQLLQILTDSFINRQDLNDFTYNQPNTQQKQQAIELYAQYLDTKKDSLDDLIDKLIREGVITAEDENGNTCAESGLTTSVKGSNWKIVKDLKGPSHKLGGIDLTIGNDGISFKRNNSDVKAKNGLLIAQDNSVLPPGKKVQVRQSDNSIKEYNINSKEYEDLYNSGHLVNYDKNTDTYIATSLPEVTITANKPQWAKDKEQFEKEYTKDMFMDETMPKFSRAMGISATNMNPNNIAEYDKRINDKVVENIFKRKPTFDTDYSNDRLKTLQGFSQKELELIKNSSYAHKIEPSIWSKFEQGLLSVGNAGSPIQFKNQNLTQDEAKKENNPLNLLQPLNIPAKIAQSTYKKDYSFSDALKGKQNNAGIVEDIVTDPLNLVGLGIWGKLSKTGKFAKLEDAYQAVNGLNKEEALNKLKQIPSDSDIEVAEQILKKSYKKEELPKLEQIPLDFNIEDLMKGISSTDRKNMTIIKEGNKYFKELNNPESLKRLKEFGDEYGIDLLDAYKKAEQRWSKGTNFREHENFQVKKTDEDWYGLSTVKRDTKDDMYRYLLQKEFGKDSKQVKDFDKKISQDNSVNYISDKVPLDKYSKTVWHELSHDINKSIIDSSPKLQEDIKSIFIEKGTADLDKVKKARESVAEDYYTKKEKVLSDLNSKESLQKVGEREFDYVTYPTETWAFLSTNLRQDLKNTGIIKNYNELLTVEKLEQAIKNGNTVFSRFEPYIKDKDKFIKLFNKMTLGIAPAVMYLQSQQKNN